MRKSHVGKDFSNQILIGVDFSKCDCQNCNFKNCDLSFAVFRDTNLYNCQFDGAILYCTIFDTVNLTRASFNQSYIYGVKFLSFANITYATFEDLRVEKYRRIGDRYNPRNDNVIKILNNYSERVEFETDNTSFLCNGYFFRFEERSKHDVQREFSQIYNRLKRVHRENLFLKDAGHYYYLERYWYRKSFCKQDLSGKIIHSKFKRGLLTIYSFLNEKICGYGERPLNTLYTALLGWFAFAVIYSLIVNNSGSHFGDFSLNDSLLLSALSMYSNQSIENLPPLIVMFSLLESLFGVIIFAIFTATIVRKIIRD